MTFSRLFTHYEGKKKGIYQCSADKDNNFILSVNLPCSYDFSYQPNYGISFEYNDLEKRVTIKAKHDVIPNTDNEFIQNKKIFNPETYKEFQTALSTLGKHPYVTSRDIEEISEQFNIFIMKTGCLTRRRSQMDLSTDKPQPRGNASF